MIDLEPQLKNVVQYPDERLLSISDDFEDNEIEEIEEIVDMLLRFYQFLPGAKVGLAAPQIGINRNAAIVMGIPMINLSFIPAKQYEIGKEGCYSIKFAGVAFAVERPKYGWATWTDPFTLEVKEQKMTGLQARVFQHELDHINGKLCSQ